MDGCRLSVVAGHGEPKKEASSSKKGGALSAKEVAKHNKKDDIWVIVDRQVLDVTSVSLPFFVCDGVC